MNFLYGVLSISSTSTILYYYAVLLERLGAIRLSIYNNNAVISYYLKVPIQDEFGFIRISINSRYNG